MAKKQSTEDKALERLEKAKQATAEAERSLALTQDEMGQQKKEMVRAKREIQKVEATQEQMMAASRLQANKLVQVGVNVGSTVGAQSINELINWGMRALAESGEKSARKENKDPTDSFWYRNVDVAQSTGGLLGSAIYALEMITRPTVQTDSLGKVLTDKDGNPLPYVLPWNRQMANELGTILQNLGMHNLFRALRFRYSEDVDERAIKDSELKAARAEIQELRKAQPISDGGEGGTR